MGSAVPLLLSRRALNYLDSHSFVVTVSFSQSLLQNNNTSSTKFVNIHFFLIGIFFIVAPATIYWGDRGGFFSRGRPKKNPPSLLHNSHGSPIGELPIIPLSSLFFRLVRPPVVLLGIIIIYIYLLPFTLSISIHYSRLRTFALRCAFA